MRSKHLILFIAGIICLTVSLIDLLSSKVVRADQDVSAIVVSTLLYICLGIAGIILIIGALVLHRKNR